VTFRAIYSYHLHSVDSYITCGSSARRYNLTKQRTERAPTPPPARHGSFLPQVSRAEQWFGFYTCDQLITYVLNWFVPDYKAGPVDRLSRSRHHNGCPHGIPLIPKLDRELAPGNTFRKQRLTSLSHSFRYVFICDCRCKISQQSWTSSVVSGTTG
jgi:hypothetical protein